jgi:hypothetical protein
MLTLRQKQIECSQKSNDEQSKYDKVLHAEKLQKIEIRTSC